MADARDEGYGSGSTRSPATPLHVIPVATRAEARARLLDRRTDAVLVVDPASRTDTLIVASAGGPPATTAATEILSRSPASRTA